MKKILSLLLAVVLIGTMPVCMATENTNVIISISDYVNYDTIFEEGKVVAKNTTFPEVIFDSSCFGSDVALGGMSYSFTGLQGAIDDSIKLSSKTTVDLNGEIYKKIGFVAYALTNAVDVTGKINYKSGNNEDFSINVKTATSTATLSKSAGKGLKKGGTNARPKAESGETDIYINAYEIIPSTASAITSVEFSLGNYVIMAVSALEYTQEELDQISSGAINSYWATYKDKTVADISDSDVDNLNTLYNGLVTAKANGTNTDIATDENITRIGNLSDGYALYKEKKGYSEYFESAYATKDYRTLSATDISDSDITVIEEIIAKYTKAESFDETKYETILTYFNLTDTFNTYDLTDKAKLVTLKTSYEFNKAEKENQDAIKAIFDVYKNKTTSELTESDVTELDKLIALYETAETNGYSYSTDDYEKIKKLRNNYVKQQSAGKYTYVDLTPYLNADLMVKQDEVYTAEEQKSLARTMYLFNGNNLPADGILTIQAPSISYAPDADQNEAGRTYKLSGSFRGKGNDVIKVASNSTAVTTVKIPETMIKSNGIGVILDTDKGEVGTAGATSAQAKKVTVNVNYTDGTVDVAQVNLLKSEGFYLSNYYPHATKIPGRLDLDTSGKIYNLGNVSGNNSPKFYSSNIAFDENKIVSSLTFNKLSDRDYTIIAIYTDPVSNADFTAMLQSQWNIVKDYDSQTITSTQLPETNKMVAYVDECDRRGIDTNDYNIDTALVDSFREMNLTATPSIFRADRNTVKAEFVFSVPVTQTDIKNKLTVTKNTNEFTDYKTEFSDNGKKLTLVFDETKNGGNEYNVTLSGGLTIAKFPSITLGNDSVISYTVPDYMEYSYDGEKFTVKNNSKETVKGYGGATVFETDEKTVAYADLKSYTVDGEDSVDVDLDTTAYTDKIKKTVLWDENMNVISNGSEVGACTTDVVATADYKEPTFDMKDNSVRLNGFTASEKVGELVSLKVVDENSNIVFAGSQKTKEDGYFDFKFIMSSATSKTLTFTIGGDGFSDYETLTKTIYYFAPSERAGYIESLKGMNETQLTTEIPTMKTKLAIAFEPASKISDSDYAKIIIANSDMLVSTDVAKTQTNLKKLAVIKSFSGNNASLLMGGNEFKYDEIMNYSGIDTDGVTLYSILKNGISDKGIAKFKEDVFNKNYANETELLLAIKQSIFLNAINYPKNSGVGYIVDLLTAKNAQSAQIVITNYLNNASYSFNTAIAQKAGSFDTLAELTAFIANYAVATAPGGISGGTTSGGSAGGSGGSISGGFSSDITEEITYIFNDVTKTHWAYENIMSLYNKGIISGKSYKTFEPESTITRGELIKMICTAYNLKAVNSGKFTDATGKWYEEYAQAGYDNGIITGITENEFGGDLPITRQDICTILYRIKKGTTTTSLTFAATDEISDYARTAVAFMVEKGIVNGFTDNTFAPLNNCTRAQASKIIDMFLQMN